MLHVEPDPNGAPDGPVIPVALGRERASRILNITRSAACSSLLRPNEAVIRRYTSPELFDVLTTEVVEMDTLDSQVELRGFRPDFLKIDVQGTELDVLAGAERALEHVVGVEVEVEFVPTYEGQALFSDIDPFLRERGFELFDLSTVHLKRRRAPGRGQAVWADALYLRPPETTTRTDALAEVAIAYRLWDLAACLGMEVPSRRRPPGSGRVAEALRRAADWLVPDGDWPTRNGRLGS